MKKRYLAFPLLVLLSLSFFIYSFRNPTPKYKASQLMEPTVLADILKDPKKPDPVILNVGSMKLIKGAVTAGPASTDDGLLNFKSQLLRYKKNQTVVIYCGCCALDHCPNIGPAMEYMQDEGYTQAKILNIEKSLKTEWEDKGYPIN